jgi:GNAT superfamily N-acetyltransferase
LRPHIERVDPASADARWCIGQYFEELRRRFDEGFDPGASLPADDGELVPPHGVFLLASLEGRPVACGAVKVIAPEVGSLKRMWVSDAVRGQGLGRQMLDALESEGRALGLRTLRLETNRALQEAIRMYRRAGYREVDAFNDDPYANHWFEKPLS